MLWSTTPLESGVGGAVGKTATSHTASLSLNAEVTLLTPVGIPGVLDDPVLHASLSISVVTDGEDGVVDLLIALVNDSTLVEMEDAGIENDGDGVHGNGVLEGLLIHLRKDNATSRLDNNLALVILAVLVSSVVGILLLSAETLVVDVVQSAPGPASVATLVLVLGDSGAIDQLLLRQGDQLTRVDEVSSLDGTSGREGPAGSARGLVLDGGDGTLISPVDSLGSITEHGGHTARAGSGILSASAELVKELLLSNISELVHTHGPVVVLGVVDSNLLQVLVEHSHTVVVLLSRRVELAILLLEVQELGGAEISSESHSKKNENNSLHTYKNNMKIQF